MGRRDHVCCPILLGGKIYNKKRKGSQVADYVEDLADLLLAVRAHNVGLKGPVRAASYIQSINAEIIHLSNQNPLYMKVFQSTAILHWQFVWMKITRIKIQLHTNSVSFSLPKLDWAATLIKSTRGNKPAWGSCLMMMCEMALGVRNRRGHEFIQVSN